MRRKVNEGEEGKKEEEEKEKEGGSDKEVRRLHSSLVLHFLSVYWTHSNNDLIEIETGSGSRSE